MAMTLRDNGKSEIRLNGPNNLSDFIHATRFFLFHESLKFDCVGFSGSDEEKYEDENLTIWPVIINGKLHVSLSFRIGSGLVSREACCCWWFCLFSGIAY